MGRPAIHLNLTQEQLEELRQFYRQTHSARERTRAHMVLLNAEHGLVAREIAELVHRDQQSVRNWIRRYVEDGIDGFSDRPRSGVDPKADSRFDEQLIEAVRHRPRALGLEFSSWTLERLSEYMTQKTGIHVSYETIRRHLLDNGIVLRRPQHKITSPDPLYTSKKRRSKRSGIT